MSDDTEKKEKLVKRLHYLWTWELFASFFLPAAVLFDAVMLDQPVGLFTIYSAALVTVLLWQGTAYWRAKLREVQSGSAIGRRVLLRFQRLKVVNWLLIGVLPALLLIQPLVGIGFRSGFDVIAALGLYTLAILEQVNYYYYQLMYDYPPDWRFLLEQKRLKRSSLSRALGRLDDQGGASA